MMAGSGSRESPSRSVAVQDENDALYEQDEASGTESNINKAKKKARRKRISRTILIRRRIETHMIVAKIWPALGSASYVLLSTKFYVPHNSLIKALRPTYQVGLTNCLIFNSHLGIGLYLYSRAHLRSCDPLAQTLFAVFGSLMFNFGSLMFWTLTSRLMDTSSKSNELMRGAGSLLISFAFLKLGHSYVKFIDESIVQSNNPSIVVSPSNESNQRKDKK